MGKKILLGLAGVALGMAILAAAGVSWLYLRRPAMAVAPVLKVPMTPERIARGEYIYVSIADCAGCHSQRDFSRVLGPEVLSGRGRGNVLSDVMKGLPGRVVAPNLTPDPETGLGTWTDGEKMRAIREGVDKNGRALFPMMPYTAYRRFSDEDVQALVAFLNSLPPIRNPLPSTSLDFGLAVHQERAPTRRTRPAGGPCGSRQIWRIPGRGRRLFGLPHANG
jgi:mono/diheme cytochrome c family protein